MGNHSESFDIKDLISYGDDLISLLNAKNGFNVVSQSFEDLKALRFRCDEDFNQTQRSIQDCKKKLAACKKKTEEACSDVSGGDDDLERLQKELDEEMELECKLKDELRVVADELKDLNAQLTSVDEQRQSIKRKERDDLRAEKKLSMYASVTKVIPTVEDPSKISGYMVDREKKVIEKFQFETNKMTAYETCNCIWSIINKQ
ncbi:kinetochore protein SPC24 homolog [Raphanus sativus]|uniref:Kinetochore protein Spc24 n=1 Tax=Raphanus sativus TaxID=3726 RepID=A0A9W3BYI9_RAPSA|nr:kinetochore protein SPC24 homolog [Raphanus sativus]XP_056845639.1 kinetochore protein SPC24 homolog [Raphanus sativus]